MSTSTPVTSSTSMPRDPSRSTSTSPTASPATPFDDELKLILAVNPLNALPRIRRVVHQPSPNNSPLANPATLSSSVASSVASPTTTQSSAASPSPSVQKSSVDSAGSPSASTKTSDTRSKTASTGSKVLRASARNRDLYGYFHGVKAQGPLRQNPQ